MLVLSRKKNERILIQGEIVVTVVQIQRNQVKIGIEAPCDVPVHRQEVAEEISRDQDRRSRMFEEFEMNGRSLLVVSNDRQTRSALASMLSAERADVDVATTSAGALEFVDEKDYDVAIIDESLDKMRGQELFERIKGLQRDLKGILCADHPTVDTVEAALDSGMNHVLQKPIDRAELLHLAKG